MVSRWKTAIVAVILAGFGRAQGASLTVQNLTMPPGATGMLIVVGEAAGEATYGVTIMVELVPRSGAVGSLEFTSAPPTDVIQMGDPWPGVGSFSTFDTNVTGAAALNGTVDDNGTFLATPLTFSGALSVFPVVASADADCEWEVRLSTSVGDSSWEGLATTLNAGTITVTSGGRGRRGSCGCTIVPYGDINGSGVIDVDDVLYALAAFEDPLSFPEADIYPCGGNGTVDVEDLLAVLDAFVGAPLCPDPCVR